MSEWSVFTYISALFSQFFDPAKRVFVLYLASAALIGIVLLITRRHLSLKYSVKALCHRKVWLSASSRSDVCIIMINQAVMILLSPLLLARLTVATALYMLLIDRFGLPVISTTVDPWKVSMAFTLCYFLLDDWSRYVLHKWMHQWPLLWCFHKVHHSARTLSPLTVYRVHPIEGILFSLRSALVQGLCTAVFIYLFGKQVSLTTVMGASVFAFVFNIAGSNLRHSHIRLNYWRPLEFLLISPFQHQLHHSSAPQHFDKNFGAMLAIWDWFGGSLVLSKKQARPRFGLQRRKQAGEQTLKTLYIQPLTEATEISKRTVRQLLNIKPLSEFLFNQVSRKIP